MKSFDYKCKTYPKQVWDTTYNAMLCLLQASYIFTSCTGYNFGIYVNLHKAAIKYVLQSSRLKHSDIICHKLYPFLCILYLYNSVIIEGSTLLYRPDCNAEGECHAIGCDSRPRHCRMDDIQRGART